MTREVCISGFSSLSRDLVHDLPDSVEVWAMNEAHYFLKRPASRWFQLHPKNWRATPVGVKAYALTGYCNTCGWGDTGKAEDEREKAIIERRSIEHQVANPEHDVEFGTVRVRKNGYGRIPQHMKWLKECGIPVYQMKVDERIPTSTQYPYNEIVEAYGVPWVNGKKRPYLTSTAAFMLALALYEHERGDPIDRIHLAGIELSIGTEYFHQRPCVEHWLGRLMQAGVEYVPSPYGTTLLQGMIYAVEHTNPLHPELQPTVGLGFKPTAKFASIKEDEHGRTVGI